MDLSKDFKVNAATKHISTAYHLAKDYVSDGTVCISYVPTTLMVADGLTKAVNKVKLDANRTVMCLHEINSGDHSV